MRYWSNLSLRPLIYFETDKSFVYPANTSYLLSTTITVLCHFQNTRGVDRGVLGPWSAKYIISMIYLPFRQCYKNVGLRMSEHGYVITQSLRLSRPKFSSKLGPPLCK